MLKTEAEMRARLADHTAWMDENEGGGSREEGVVLGWMLALAWALGERTGTYYDD